MKAISLFAPLLAGLLGTMAGSALAVVSTPGTDFGNGDYKDISYGAAADGNVFALSALLFPAGDGLLTQQVKTRISTLPDFTLALGAPKNAGTSLEELDYRITNVGPVAHNDLRFMITLGADGNPSTFAESVAETWGPIQPGDPTRRQSIDWGATGDDTAAALNNAWASVGGAPPPEGAPVPASCKSTSGCDSYVGLQWDIPSLKPGESLLVRVGLSDDGQHLSSRYFTLTADPTGGISNALTFSGTAQIVAVPEPSSYVMLLGGLGLIAFAWRRRSSQQI